MALSLRALVKMDLGSSMSHVGTDPDGTGVDNNKGQGGILHDYRAFYHRFCCLGLEVKMRYERLYHAPTGKQPLH